MTNSEIANLLRNVAAAYTIKDEKKFHFQIVAYEKASDAIAKLTTEVSDLYKENKLNTIPGIGPTLQSHLEELMQQGKVKHFNEVLKGIPESVFPLLAIPSFGPKKGYKLVTSFHLKNPQTVIADVVKHAEKGDIAKLPTFGEKSQSDILRAVGEFHKGAGKTTRMLLPFALEVAEKMATYLRTTPAVVKAEPLGSLRRRRPTVGDIDIAVASDKPHEVIEHFASYPYKKRVIEKGPATSSILTNGGQQIDLMVQPVESFGSLLQHFTGSKNHNIHLRDYALKKGLSLSEYGIKNLKSKEGVRKHFATEQAFYQALGMDWIPPELREDTGEIEAAINHKLPHLIEAADIKGDLHTHSSYPIEPSHDMGINTMQEHIDAAHKLHYEYIGFSEHNPSISKHTKDQIYTILAKRQEYIEQLKLKNKSVRIINLLEIDILPNGNLAIDEKGLSYLDAAIVSIHSVFNMNEEQMTKRVLQGLSHPKAKILAHPTGRMLNERSGYSLDFERIFTFCKEHHKAMEINAWPERSDLPDTLIRQAIDAGVTMVIDTDSHAVTHMEVMMSGVFQARRGWAEKRDIINTKEYNQFINWLET
ncbi:MAG TPA: hypothetical protein VGT05_03970 [Patescibacteria group bacterium]|nr:hypothetical protein [Patescibacteria group bacterium]